MVYHRNSRHDTETPGFTNDHQYLRPQLTLHRHRQRPHSHRCPMTECLVVPARALPFSKTHYKSHNNTSILGRHGAPIVPVSFTPVALTAFASPQSNTPSILRGIDCRHNFTPCSVNLEFLRIEVVPRGWVWVWIHFQFAVLIL